MIDLAQRSQMLELMDMPDHSIEEWRACLGDIDRLNRWTGMYSQILRFVEAAYLRFRQSSTRPMSILDVGYGSGELLAMIEQMAKRKNYKIELCGIDLNPWAKIVANERNPQASIRFQIGDFLKTEEPSDVVISTLVSHHLNREELNEFYLALNRLTRFTWLIHDLHRHFISYYGLKVITKLGRLHPMVRNDGPLSVAKGFRRQELQQLIDASEASSFEFNIKWHMPFKYQVSALRRQHELNL